MVVPGHQQYRLLQSGASISKHIDQFTRMVNLETVSHQLLIQVKGTVAIVYGRCLGSRRLARGKIPAIVADKKRLFRRNVESAAGKAAGANKCETRNSRLVLRICSQQKR